jgi:hypothetical protein
VGLGLASFGVRGDLVERWKAALRDGVKGLATLCLSEVIVAEREEQVALRSAGSEHDALD